MKIPAGFHQPFQNDMASKVSPAKGSFERAWQKVDCPKCAVMRDERCRDKHGRYLSSVHNERLRALHRKENRDGHV